MPIQCTCLQCGSQFQVPPRTVKKGAGKYCSRACKHQAQRSAPITLTCGVCGKPYDVRPSDLSDGRRHCSWECRVIGIRGAGSAGWRNSPDYRGWDWTERRAEALERDGHRCTDCGKVDHLVVHHITPWVETQDNSLDNLQTLCISCHIKRHPIAEKLARIAS